MAKSSSVTMEDKDWRAESDMRTLIDAQEIMKDKARYKAAMAEAKKRMAAMQAVVKDSAEEASE